MDNSDSFSLPRPPRTSGALVALFRDTTRESGAPNDDTAEPNEQAAPTSEGQSIVRSVPLTALRASPYQARESFVAIEELSQSISKKGVLQPILVRALEASDAYEVIAGERRCRAAELAGLTEIPAIVLSLTDRESAEVALIENAQREDLNPVEEASGYLKLSQTFGMNQAQIAEVVGKSRAYVANALRLLHLPQEILEMLRHGTLSAGHARALLAVPDPKRQIRIAKKVLERGSSVRALEDFVRRLSHPKRQRPAIDEETKSSLERYQTKVSETLGVEKVNLQLDHEGRRHLRIVFDNDTSWRRFMTRIRK